jgi:hypothetical protein
MTVGLLRYSISKRKRLIDSEPMKRGEAPLVWSPAKKEWVDVDLESGEYAHSLPITDEKAHRFLETDEIPDDVSENLRAGIIGDREVA